MNVLERKSVKSEWKFASFKNTNTYIYAGVPFILDELFQSVNEMLGFKAMELVMGVAKVRLLQSFVQSVAA